MEALVRRILDELANDPQVHASNINVELQKVGGLFKKRTALHVFGSVNSEEERETVMRTVKRAAGEQMEITSDLAVKHHEAGTSA
ncbi:hypothetical protein [Salinispira pacifica]